MVKMRIEIKSSDRIGISQEILTVFARQAWNLKAVEVSKGFTFAHLEHPNLQLNEISDCLASIDGIISVSEISLLPIEQRENHSFWRAADSSKYSYSRHCWSLHPLSRTR